MVDKIYIAVLEDHQGVIDGYRYRLADAMDLEIVATASYGEDLYPMLRQHTIDVLLLDINMPTSPSNPSHYPILYHLPKLVNIYPDLAILIISMYAQHTLIHTAMSLGVSGYILKEDHVAICELPSVIRTIRGGGVYLSPVAYQQFMKRPTSEINPELSERQLEALTLCDAYPNASTAELADKMNVAHSTLRNLLSNAYLKLNVRTRLAAIARARQLGFLSPSAPPVLNLDDMARPPVLQEMDNFH